MGSLHQNREKRPRLPDALLEVAASVGTPTYVYEESILRARSAAIREALASIEGRLLYAMKANSNPAILRILFEEVEGLDAVSPAEVLLAARLGFDPANILFSPNNPSDEEMDAMSRMGALLNLGELSRLEHFATIHPGSAVCIRLNPQIGAGHHRYVITGGEHSKFGMSPGDIPDLLAVCERFGVRVVGLHQHIGSGFSDSGTLSKAIEFLLEASVEFADLEFINFGGGLGISYRADEPGFDIDQFQKSICIRLQEFKERDGRPIEYWFEPGRFLTAESGTLLIRVTAVKHTGSGVFVGTDSGFNHLIRPVLYGAYHTIYNLSNPDGELESVHVAGNICEAGDLFATDRAIRQVREGDVLAILDTGAYGMSMASMYNLRPLPAEVVIRPNGSKDVVRPRRSSESLIDRFLDEHNHPSGLT